VQCDLTLTQAGGFQVTLVQHDCGAMGDSVRVTKPVAAVLTADACYTPVGTTWKFNGPYPAGTAVALVFTSGSVYGTNVGNAHSGVLVSGSYPQWTLGYEDGGAPWDYKDVQMSVQAF
jgi:hypothetical protein